MQKTSAAQFSVLAIIGITALSTVACGSSTKSSSSESASPATSTSVAAPASETPVKADGELEVGLSLIHI